MLNETFILTHDASGQVVPGRCTGYRRMKLYGYGSGGIKYLCRNTSVDAEETDEDWDIWKFSDEDLPTLEGPRVGAVNTEGVVDGLGWKT